MASVEKKIMHVLTLLGETSSTNGKLKILKKYSDFKELQEYFILALSPQMTYNMKTVPKIKKDLFDESYSWKQVIKTLKKYSEKPGLTDKEKQALGSMCDSNLRRELVSRIIKKNLKCGVKIKLINKVWNRLIEVVPYQRCSLTDKIDKVSFPARWEIKADGMFDYAFIGEPNDETKVTFKTRNGNIFPLDNVELEEELSDLRDQFGRNIVLTGEFRVKGPDGEYLPRKIGNGLLNSILQGKGEESTHENTFFTVWDILYREEYEAEVSRRPLKDRCADLDELSHYWFIDKIESGEANSIEEVYEIAEKVIAQGGEGIVLKDYMSFWKNHTCPLWIKFKSEKECDLRITGWNYAEDDSKYDGLVGSVVCESECGKLKVNVSGLNDDERKWDWDKHIGKIMTVKFNEVIDSKSKKDKTKSMFLPRVSKKSKGEFVEFRLDKSKADTLQRIMKM